MSDESRKSRKGGATATRRPSGKGKQTRAKGEASAVTAHEIVFMVARVAGGFEALLKTKTPALSLSQWTMLEWLSQEGGSARPSQIARRLGFSRQLIRQAGKKLLSLELIAQEEPEAGKKAVALRLTEAGRTMITDIGASTDALSESLKANKRGGGLAQAARSLKALSTSLVVKEGGSGKGRAKKAEAADAAPAEA